MTNTLHKIIAKAIEEGKKDKKDPKRKILRQLSFLNVLRNKEKKDD